MRCSPKNPYLKRSVRKIGERCPRNPDICVSYKIVKFDFSQFRSFPQLRVPRNERTDLSIDLSRSPREDIRVPCPSGSTLIIPETMSFIFYNDVHSLRTKLWNNAQEIRKRAKENFIIRTFRSLIIWNSKDLRIRKLENLKALKFKSLMMRRSESLKI